MLLAIDTSTQYIGLAVHDGAEVIGEMIWRTQNHHTVELAPAIDKLLERCALQPNRIEVLAIALGPGSFTGLRIGLAAVKGMSLALRIPVLGVPTLDFLMAGMPLSRLPAVAVLQAGRGRLAVGWYAVSANNWLVQDELELMAAENLAQRISAPTLVCGELSASDRQVIERLNPHIRLASPAQSLRRPSYLAELAWRRWRAGESDAPAALAPIYLYAPGATPA